MKNISILLLLIFIPNLLVGQNDGDFSQNETILFKVTHNNSNKTSYLFGTHHAFGKVFFDSLTEAKNALKTSEIAIFESIDIPGQTAQDIINRRKTKTAWEKYLSKNDLTFIKNLFAKSPTDFYKLTPTEMYVFLNRNYKQQVCLNKSINDTSLSLDGHISSLAEQMGTQIIGLETVAEQIEKINKDVEGMPKRSHKRRLSHIISKLESEDSSNCEETAWFSNMKIDLRLNVPCNNSLMLTDRNEKWMKTITPLIEKKNCFIAVGFSHLMYECGLINELEALGYIIEPINLK